jgi:GNAT superfamily N-acetyltransferase
MITAGDGAAGAAGSPPGRVLAIRDRTESDLGECVRLLADVHRRDGYPMHWPADPRHWLDPPEIFAAWVATLDGQVAGHVALSATSRGDAAPQLLGLSDPGATGGGGGAAGGGAAGGATAGGGTAGGGTAGGGELADGGDAAGGGGVAMLSRLFVSGSARGYGAGRALIHQAMRAAHERGQHLLLDVHSANTSAIALYERLGWNFLGATHAQWGPDRVTLRSYAAPTR